MKIVHLIFAFKTGGSETMLVDILNDQIKGNHLTLIILNNQINHYLIDKIDKRVKIIKVNRKEKSRNLLPIILLNLHILFENPDVIHCHHSSAARIIFLKRNLILTVHEINSSLSYFSKYQKIISISNAVKKDIEKRGLINAKTIYNGININQILQKTDYKFANFKIIQISRLDHKKKGQHIVLEAINLIINKYGIKNVRIDFIGEGISESYLKSIIRKYNIENYVNFLGLQERDFIYKHLKDYDLLIQPSLYEGFGLTVAEGMAAKVPVLVSNINGPMEIVENGKYGWVFESDNKDDCAGKILDIMKHYNNSEFQSKIISAFDFACSSFSIENTSKNYLFEYRNLIDH
jgi:glycosyltransferase involved in cell wall biosynthesis